MEVLNFVDGISHFKVKYLTLKEGKTLHKLKWKQSNNFIFTHKLSFAGLTAKRDFGNSIHN